MNAPDLPIEVSCPDVQARLHCAQPPLLLDCREQDEYALVNIAGARLVPMSQIGERVAELNDLRASEVIVYCHHGARSLQVATWLRQQGFARAQSMTGGIDAWSVQIDGTLPRY